MKMRDEKFMAALPAQVGGGERQIRATRLLEEEGAGERGQVTPVHPLLVGF